MNVGVFMAAGDRSRILTPAHCCHAGGRRFGALLLPYEGPGVARFLA